MLKNQRESWLIITLSLAFVLGWLVAYGNSVFFNPKGEMDQRPSLPSSGPIGGDLDQLLSYSNELRKLKSPYIGSNIYAPSVSVLALPLTYVNRHAAFLILSTLTLLGLIGGLILAEAFLGNKKELSGFYIFFLVTTILSYGFVFELERGQLNVITAFFVVLAIGLYKQNKTLLAILSLSVAIQLKISPVIFSLLFITFPLVSVKNARRLLAIGLINSGLLFMLGFGNYFTFIDKIHGQFSKPFLWVGNHSLLAYCSKVTVGVCNVSQYPYILGLCFALLVSC